MSPFCSLVPFLFSSAVMTDPFLALKSFLFNCMRNILTFSRHALTLFSAPGLRHVFSRLAFKSIPEEPQSLANRALEKALHLLIESLGINQSCHLVVFRIADRKPLDRVRNPTVSKYLAALAC